MAITISDVAKEAGVSISTVSKVLNGWSTISPSTREKVQAAIQKLNYTPNARAVNFARKATMNIVFLTALTQNKAYENPHMFDIMCGVQNALAQTNYSLTLVDTSQETYPGETASRIISQKCADAIVVHGSAISEETAHLFLKEKYPHIVIGHPDFSSHLCWIDTNHTLAGEFAAEHMISCGYTDTAFIGGKSTDVISIQRQKGFLGLMNKYGYQVTEEHIIYTDSSIAESCQATHALLNSPHRPRAIICENNMIALGVSKAIEKSGLRVPEDIAFLTFDVYPYSAIIAPRPTVIDIQVYDLGRQAGMMILHKLAHPDLQIQSFTTLPLLIQGETTQVITSSPVSSSSHRL